MADGSLFHILAGMVVLSQHWYNSSAGDGSLLSIGVAQSASKVGFGLAPLYFAHWSGHLHIVGHCQSEGLWGCHALKTSPSAVRQPCWHCSGQVEGIKLRSSSSRSCPLPGGQFLLA